MRHQRIFGATTPLLLGAALLFGGSATAQAACGLKSADNKIKHVVHIQFDNVHLRRDNPNVPSDLEQMPNLLDFMQNNGTVSGNHHTPLISHTATDILTVLTGAYGDRMGVPVANSYGFFRADGSVGGRSIEPHSNPLLAVTPRRSFCRSLLRWITLPGVVQTFTG